MPDKVGAKRKNPTNATPSLNTFNGSFNPTPVANSTIMGASMMMPPGGTHNGANLHFSDNDQFFNDPYQNQNYYGTSNTNGGGGGVTNNVAQNSKTSYPKIVF